MIFRLICNGEKISISHALLSNPAKGVLGTADTTSGHTDKGHFSVYSRMNIALARKKVSRIYGWQNTTYLQLLKFEGCVFQPRKFEDIWLKKYIYIYITRAETAQTMASSEI